MANALAKIRTRAKAILKKHPNKKYQTALKEAGRDYRNGKIAGVKKKGAKKKRVGSAPKKKATPKRPSTSRRIGNIGGESLAQSQASTLRLLKDKLGWYRAAQITAKTKPEKKRLGVKIREVESKIKALC